MVLCKVCNVHIPEFSSKDLDILGTFEHDVLDREFRSLNITDVGVADGNDDLAPAPKRRKVSDTSDTPSTLIEELFHLLGSKDASSSLNLSQTIE